jgi:hypothetical protein
MLRLATTAAQPACAAARPLETGDREDLLAGLARPRTTLRQPFDLVAL